MENLYRDFIIKIFTILDYFKKNANFYLKISDNLVFFSPRLDQKPPPGFDVKL